MCKKILCAIFVNIIFLPSLFAKPSEIKIKPYIFTKHDISSMAINQKANELAVLDSLNKTLNIWDMKFFKEIKKINVVKPLYKPKLEYLPNSSNIIVLSKNKLNIYNTKSEKIVDSYVFEHSIHDYSISPKGNSIVVSIKKSFKVFLIDLKIKKYTEIFKNNFYNVYVGFLSENSIATISQYATSFYNIKTKLTNNLRLKGQSKQTIISNVSFSKDGKYMIIENLTKPMNIYKLNNKQKYDLIKSFDKKSFSNFSISDDSNILTFLNNDMKSLYSYNLDNNHLIEGKIFFHEAQYLSDIISFKENAIIVDNYHSISRYYFVDILKNKILKQESSNTDTFNYSTFDEVHKSLKINYMNTIKSFNLKSAKLDNIIEEKGFLKFDKNESDFVHIRNIKNDLTTIEIKNLKKNKILFSHTFDDTKEVIIEYNIKEKFFIYYDYSSKSLIKQDFNGTSIYKTSIKITSLLKYKIQGNILLVYSSGLHRAKYKYDKSFWIVDIQNGNLIAQIPVKKNLYDFSFYSKNHFTLLFDNELQIIDLKNQVSIKTIQSEFKNGKIETLNDEFIIVKYEHKNTIKIIDIKKNTINEIINMNINANISKLQEDSMYITFPNLKNELLIYSLNKNEKKILNGEEFNSNIHDSIIVNNSLLIIVFSNGQNLIYDLKLQRKLGTLFSFKEGWLFVTPNGYFNTEGNIFENMIFLDQNKKVFDVSQLYDHFYRPDLVKLKLAGKDISKYTNGLTYEDALKNPPPKIKLSKIDNQKILNSGFKNEDVNIKKDKITLKFNVSQHDKGGIGLIRIYQEGKLIKTIGEGKVNKQAANVDTLLEQDNIDNKMKLAQNEYINKMTQTVTRSINTPISEEDSIGVVKTSTVQNKEGNYEIELDLISGKNEIAIEAFNKTNTVTSYKETLTINAKIPKKEPKLYAIVAGVNKFQAPFVSDLKYSENDAKDIKSAIENEQGKKYKNIEIKYHIGKDVTKEKLLKSIQEVIKKASIEDTVVFYISTHGKAYKGKLLLVPQNNQKISDWINFEDIFKSMQKVKALKQIFVLDTCESGKANDIVSSVYDSKASVLARSSGVHMLLATTKGTFAFEHPDPKVKNGVFTHKILQALKNNKIDKNKDKFISIIELSDKLKEPSNNADYQYPIIRNVGSDILVKKVVNE